MNAETSKTAPDDRYSPEGHEDPKIAWGRCAIEAHAYSASQGQGLVRVTGLTYPGREHWASIAPVDEETMECEVRDGTMRQFSPDAPQLFQGPLDEWLDDCVELMRDDIHYEIFRTPSDPEPIYADDWIREDLEPGNSLPHPWAE